MPGAFASTLSVNGDVRALYNHDPSAILGRTGSGTLRLEDRADGLHFELDLPDTTLGRDTRTLIERKDIPGMSFGFKAKKDRWKEPETRGGMARRFVDAADLFEVSLTPVPFYGDTSVSMRSYEAASAEWEKMQLAQREMFLARLRLAESTCIV